MPGCRSAWKKPSRNTWLKNAAGGVAQQVGDRWPAASERGAVVDPDAGDPLDGQHGAAGAQPIDPRHAKSRGRRRNSRRVRRPPPPRSANPFRAAPTSARVSTTSTGFSRRSDGCVRSISRASQRNRSRSRAKARGDAGPQHLDRDLAPVGRDGEMHLRDRRGGDRRLRRTTRTASSSGRAEFGLDQRLRLARRERAAAGPASVARSSVISSPRRSARVDSSWPSLMKLGPSSSKRRGEPLARPRCADAAAAAHEQPADAQQRRRRRDVVEQEQRVVARQDQRDPDEAGEVAAAAEEPEHRAAPGQSRQAEWSAAMPPVRLRNLTDRARPRRSSRPVRPAAETAGCSRPDRRRRRGRR